MLYRTLVSRVSELSRTLVQSGSQGEFDEGGSVFRAGFEIAVPVREGFQLKILRGAAQGSYQVAGNAGARVIAIEGEFAADDGPVPWELYDEGVDEETVRKVLQAFPDAVMGCEEDEQVRTPLGVFKIVRRRCKQVRSPSGVWTYAPERIQARIRPGKRLQRATESPSGLPPCRPKSPDEDPES